MPKVLFERSEDSLVNYFRSKLYGYWQLNGTGASFYRSGKDGLDQPLVVNCTYVNGLSRRCANFNGSSYYLNRASTSFGDMSTEFTFSCWVKFDNFAQINFLARKNNNDVEGTGAGWALWASSSDISFRIRTGTPQYGVTHLTTVPTDTWMNITVTHDYTTYSRLYVNGLHAQSGTSTADSASNTANFELGRGNYAGTVRYLAGQMQDVWMIQQVLTPGEVFQLYSNLR